MRRPGISCIIFYIQFQTEYDKVHLLGGEKLGYDPKKKKLSFLANLEKQTIGSWTRKINTVMPSFHTKNMYLC